MNYNDIKKAASDFAGPRTEKNASVVLVSRISFEAGANWEKMELIKAIKRAYEAIKSQSEYVEQWDLRGVPSKYIDLEFEKLINL